MQATFILPTSDDIHRLSRSMPGYPAHLTEFIWRAQAEDYDESMLRFLMLFPAETEFVNPDDFTGRCEGLCLMLCEKRDSLREPLLSPQD